MTDLLTPPPLWEHQARDIDFILQNPCVFDTSDPGTGKTRKYIDVHARTGGKMLVLATKSILQSAWGNDIERYQPDMTYIVAEAKNRLEAFSVDDYDVYITNHDAVKWLVKQPKLMQKFQDGRLVIDESTAFKHRTSQRSKAVAKLRKYFLFVNELTGTPSSNTVLDLWHQIFILDGGERLGKFFSFRNSCTYKEQTGPSSEMCRYVDKPGIEVTVAGMIDDITIRNRFEDCMDIPPNHSYFVPYQMSPKHRKIYRQFEQDAVMLLKGDKITAIQASSEKQKLLQIASGAVYNDDGGYTVVDAARYDAVLDLVEARDHCLVAFEWRHQRELIAQYATNRGFKFAWIDGSVSSTRRTQIVKQFQEGEYKFLLCQPASAGHGLTLTKGTSTIWASPTYNAEHWEQMNRRIYRGGQTQKTETVKMVATDSYEEGKYAQLEGKVDRQANFLDVVAFNHNLKAA